MTRPNDPTDLTKFTNRVASYYASIADAHRDYYFAEMIWNSFRPQMNQQQASAIQRLANYAGSMLYDRGVPPSQWGDGEVVDGGKQRKGK
jgi:hypothetical protein